MGRIARVLGPMAIICALAAFAALAAAASPAAQQAAEQTAIPQPAAKEAPPSTPPPPPPPAVPEAPAQSAPAPEAPPEPKVVKETRDGMGTRLEIMVWSSDEPGARDAMGAAFEEMDRVARALSEWEPKSDVSKLNQGAGGAPVAVGSELLTVLDRGKRLSVLTSGAFSLSWAALASLWDFSPGQEAPVVPDVGKAKERAALVDDNKIVADRQRGTAKLGESGMSVGLAGIAKGYALDRALQVLQARGLRDALVFAGGDMVVSGTKGDTPWLVGLQDPRASGYFATLPMQDQAIATSGDYERFFEVDGVRYHHLLDPRTGMPARGTRAATVLADDGITADALATAVFVLGPTVGMELVESQRGVEAIVVDASNKVSLSSGLKSRVRMVREPTQ